MGKTPQQMAGERIAKEKRDRFVKVAGQRVQKAIKAIALVGNCSAKVSYGYEREDVDLMMDAIDEVSQNVRVRFSNALTAPSGETPTEAFSFTKPEPEKDK